VEERGINFPDYITAMVTRGDPCTRSASEKVFVMRRFRILLIRPADRVDL
jgi:hypothetical protein